MAERVLAGGWAVPYLPKARTGAACMPGFRTAWAAPGGRRQRALPGCPWTGWEGISGAWAFPSPGAGRGWTWGAVLTRQELRHPIL